MKAGDFLDVTLKPSQAAKLLNCTDRAIRKQISQGRIQYTQTLNARNRPEYQIPLSALPAEIQRRYYDQHGLCVETSAARQAACKPIDHYTEAERREISWWVQTIERWEAYRSRPGVNATEMDKRFEALLALECPERAVSIKTLYRKRKAMREQDWDALIDNRGKARRGKTILTPKVETAFLTFYLDESRHPIQRCVRLTEEWARQNEPDALPLPGYSTFYRRAQAVPYPVQVLCREGEKAYYDKCSPYIRREYESIASNDWWIGDTHTLDVTSMGPDGKQHRLYLSAWLDARSGIFVGWYVTDRPSSQSTLNALRKGILSYGIPANVYVDNGREFLTYDIGGRGHRAKKVLADGSKPFAPPGVFERLGIKMTNAIVRNARAKLVERRFEDVKNYISRLFPTYTGGNVLEKPSRLKHVLKAGKIPTDAEVIAAVDTLIAGYLNCEPYGGSVAEDKGKRRIDVYFAHRGKVRKADPESLRLMLMRTSRPVMVGRRGVSVPIYGVKVDFYTPEFVQQMQGKQVYVRYDPEDLASVRVYSMEDKYLATLPQNTMTAGYFAAQEQIAEMQQAKRKAERATAEYAKALRLPDDPERALELMKAIAERNIEALPAGPNAKVLELVRVQEEPLLRAVGDIDLDRMISNMETGGYDDE